MNTEAIASAVRRSRICLPLPVHPSLGKELCVLFGWWRRPHNPSPKAGRELLGHAQLTLSL